jgi:hypothetical protein
LIETVQDAFIEFEQQTARVPDAQNARAKEVHPDVVAAIKADLGDLFDRAFLAGSYRRKVQAVRLKDVDIIIVLYDPDGEFKLSANAALERVRKAAKTCDLVIATRKSVRAVKLDIDGEEFTVDVVPALEDPLGELLLCRNKPDEGYDDWTSARPQGQLDAATEKNQDTGGVFIPATRIMKVWNQSFGESDKKAMPSYLAESILFHSLDSKCDYDDAMVGFFREAKDHLSRSWPSVPCPGDPANYVDQMLKDERRERALKKVETALKHAEPAVDADDPGESMDHWAKVFGTAFPAPCNDSGNLAAALKSGRAEAKGIGIVVPSGTNGGDRRPIIAGRSHRQA